MSGFAEGEVTDLLRAWQHGDVHAEDVLLRRVYAELHRIASSAMRRERSDHTLEPRALVHEAYLRLVGQKGTDWQSRSHFFAVAAKMMRRVLLDHAKRRAREKRGGGMLRVVLAKDDHAPFARDRGLPALDDALVDLAATDPLAASIVELRFFGGLTVDECAAALGMSPRTLARRWTLARAWLLRELTTDEADGA